MSDTPANSLGQALPEAVTELYSKWRECGDDQHLTLLVRALFETLEVSGYDAAYASKGDATVILEDLGIDSLTMAEMLFYTEDLMGIRIPNEDVVKIHTIGELKGYIAERCKELPKE